MKREITYFTPGQPAERGPPLAPYRPATPGGALEPYLDAYARPGDLVIDLFCQGPALLHEAAQAGRRALGLNVNRALLLAASLGLTAVERQEVEAAFTRLAEARKGSETLQAHIEGLYRTMCAACGAATVADAFVWERDGQGPAAPLVKRYRCAACGQATPDGVLTDEADRAAAACFSHQARRGLSYWLMLDRAAPSDAPYRDRMTALLDLYTPRNLSALNDLLLKSDGLTLTPPVRRVLDALLLDTLDQATSLRPPSQAASRPRRLQRPARYVEANVWWLFERALESWRATSPTPVPRAPTLEALLSQSSASPALISISSLSARQAGRDLPPACTALIVAAPPRPDLALWHLTALWCGWLWGPQAVAPLAPFLRRRRLGWDWFWRGLRGAFQAVAPLLRPGGRLVCLLTDGDAASLEALTLAVAGAGYELVGWGAQPPQARLVWRCDKPGGSIPAPGRTVDTVQPVPVPVEADALSRAVAERAVHASLDVLRLRGEPTVWPILHTTVYADLAASGLLAQAATLADDIAEPLHFLTNTVRSALGGAPLCQISPPHVGGGKGAAAEPLWWLDESLEPQADPPLSDRVELAVAEILRDLLAVTETDLQRRVCARFPGPQTPDARLVRLCLFSYGDEHALGHWRLRVEDDFEARVAETDAVIADLAALGRRLGFDIAWGIPRAGEWAARWLDETGHTVYAFAVRTTAVLGDLLFNPPQPEPETTPCLTLPGGRAVLVGYKLRHDPRLRQVVAHYGWQFLKFRHLRHLVREVAARQLDRYAFRAALGLDPIVEQVEAQMSLW